MAESAIKPADRPVGAEKTWISYEDFLKHDWPNPHVEWVNGEVVPMPPVTDEHSNEDTWLGGLFRVYAEQYGGRALREPFQMKAANDLPGRAPDLVYVSSENRHRVKSLFLDGAADVVVEIISPGSVTTDRRDKYREYERGRVREYWIIDPRRKVAEFYRLGAEGLFHVVQPESGIFRSEAMPRFWIEVAWLWPPNQPTLIDVLRAWKLI